MVTAAATAPPGSSTGRSAPGSGHPALRAASAPGSAAAATRRPPAAGRAATGRLRRAAARVAPRTVWHAVIRPTGL
ncbi:hypothetical protein ADK60_29005 [Streptomyces sp. XY431]|nr:hypothetical protein ADK60_29005 [Streptomyces sp. XY431]